MNLDRRFLFPSGTTPIDAVIFDYGNVISLPQQPSDLQRMAAICKMAVPQFEGAYWKLRVAYDRGDMDGKSYWTQLMIDSKYIPTEKEISELIALDIQSWMRVNEATITWIHQLHNAGVRLALLSNMPAELARFIEVSCPWTSYFEHLFFSCDLGEVKPNRSVYFACLKKMKCEADKALFIDDRAENVAAATALGMHAVLFDNVENVRATVEGGFDVESATR